MVNFELAPTVEVGTQAATIGFERDRILDRDDCLNLGRTLLARLGSGMPDPAQERVKAFLLDRLRCKVDVGTLTGQLERWVLVSAQGLSQWVPRIRTPHGVLRVQGTAGSGKTQLAVSLLRRATARGLRCAYICFNRPLADHMRQILPHGCEVRTFHQLCWEETGFDQGSPEGTAISAQRLAQAVDWYRDQLVNHADQAESADLDVLVVDELQDFLAPWLEILLLRVRVLQGIGEAGETDVCQDDDAVRKGLYLLDDPNQCLYEDRDELDIADAVVIRCLDNHRSPKKVVDTINGLHLTGHPLIAFSPFDGEVPGIRTWKAGNAQAMLSRTADAVQTCLDKGFSIDQIVVLTWRGLSRSVLAQSDALGSWRLSRYSGAFDGQQRPIQTEGDLLLETLRRFKGQSAPAVVLTEVDENHWVDLHRRMLFVGMTRATVHLELVISDRAETWLVGRFGTDPD